jgi:AhpD family alkylhydroperoxidase
MTMKTRFNIFAVAPDAYKAVLALENYVAKESGLPHRLIHLIKLRASILNGCAFCVDMHAKEARKDGLSEQWINLVSVWREAAVYSDQERAVLAWTDAVTLVSQTGAPDADYEAIKAHFSEEEISKITVAIGAINVWNRLAVSARLQHPVDASAKAA